MTLGTTGHSDAVWQKRQLLPHNNKMPNCPSSTIHTHTHTPTPWHLNWWKLPSQAQCGLSVWSISCQVWTSWARDSCSTQGAFSHSYPLQAHPREVRHGGLKHRWGEVSLCCCLITCALRKYSQQRPVPEWKPVLKKITSLVIRRGDLRI